MSQIIRKCETNSHTYFYERTETGESKEIKVYHGYDANNTYVVAIIRVKEQIFDLDIKDLGFMLKYMGVPSNYVSNCVVYNIDFIEMKFNKYEFEQVSILKRETTSLDDVKIRLKGIVPD